jgi:tRNA-specific 2-thiouridylase
MPDDLGRQGRRQRVVVAMSGGVDSSLAAALMVEAGHDVVGITLQLYDRDRAGSRQGSCCAGQDIYDARRVADRLGIPHYVLDFETRFRRSVIDDFVDTYVQGETPIPCIRCNQTVKFRDLMATARDLGAECLVTGHYVRRIEGSEGPELHRAVDRSRDQSYFLFATTRSQLDRLRFPLGAMTKDETRATARRLHLPVADKPDSQDICFVPTGRYDDIVRKLRPEADRPGDIVDVDGRVLGRHAGIVGFTVGQRRGLGIGGRTENSEPYYVIRLEPEQARVVVGTKQALAKSELRLGRLNWLDAGPVADAGRAVAVRVRSTQEPAPAQVFADGDLGATIRFAEPQYGVAPGQAGVIYDGERVLGGGWIGRTPP